MRDPAEASTCEHVATVSIELERADHFFDGWLTVPQGSPLEAFAEFYAILLNDDVARKRKRKRADEANFKLALRSLVANLAYPLIAELGKPDVAVPLAKPNAKASKRYPSAPGVGILPKLIEQLAERGMLALKKSRKKGVASSITAHTSLTRFVVNQGLTAADLKHWPGRQTIVLRNVEKFFWTERRKYQEFDYADTEETRRMRSEMSTINAMLARPQISMIDRPQSVVLSQRTMRRAFITDNQGDERFDLGGRLWGGFWQNMPRELRPRLFIDAERVADVDFVSMYVRLAYLRADLVPPDGDLYAGILPAALGSRHRGIVKICVMPCSPPTSPSSAVLETPRSRSPKAGPRRKCERRSWRGMLPLRTCSKLGSAAT